MTPPEIEKFHLLALMQILELFNPDLLDSVDDYGDYALLSYSLVTPMPMEKVLDRMEDGMNLCILYHVLTSSAADAGEHGCGYSSPMNGTMYKVNAQTGAGRRDRQLRLPQGGYRPALPGPEEEQRLRQVRPSADPSVDEGQR